MLALVGIPACRAPNCESLHAQNVRSLQASSRMHQDRADPQRLPRRIAPEGGDASLPGGAAPLVQLAGPISLRTEASDVA